MSDNLREGMDIQETGFGGPKLSRERRVIHFSSGETLEEELEDSETEEEEEDSASKHAFSESTQKAEFSWKNVAIRVGRVSLNACDFFGEKLSGLLGLNAAKYQYAIDQYHRENKISANQGAEDGFCDGQGERTNLSSRLDREYGATSTLKHPALSQASNGHKCTDDISTGSHNGGYQKDDDDDDHLK